MIRSSANPEASHMRVGSMPSRSEQRSPGRGRVRRTRGRLRSSRRPWAEALEGRVLLAYEILYNEPVAPLAVHVDLSELVADPPPDDVPFDPATPSTGGISGAIGAISDPIVNFPGITSSSNPPDTVGDV